MRDEYWYAIAAVLGAIAVGFCILSFLQYFI